MKPITTEASDKQPDGETDNSSVTFVNGGTLKKKLAENFYFYIFDFLSRYLDAEG